LLSNQKIGFPYLRQVSSPHGALAQGGLRYVERPIQLSLEIDHLVARKTTVLGLMVRIAPAANHRVINETEKPHQRR
jgi:hypothetical protein